MKPLYVENGSFLFKEGDYVSRIYFVVSGHLSITLRLDGLEAEVEDLYRGCSLSLYCALLGEPHTMNAQAKTPLNVYYIEIDYIRELAPYIFDVFKSLEKTTE